VPFRATGSFGTYATTPVVINGTVYTQDINSNVYSINLTSGNDRGQHGSPSGPSRRPPQRILHTGLTHRRPLE
jgi:hypothetical protein